MAWNFEISWVLGKAIPTPDTTSRQQQATTGTDDDLPAAPAALRLDKEASPDLAGDEEFAAYGRLKAGEINAVTWERVQRKRGETER